MGVEQGGTGTGTRVRFQMRAMGSARNFRAMISAPVPGRVLVESSAETGSGAE